MDEALGKAYSCPILPGVDYDSLIAFYAPFGFETRLRMEEYLILALGPIELHFFPYPDLDPYASYAGAYVQTPDVDALHARFDGKGLPADGIPRLSPVADMPWQMREFHLVDPSGNLLRFGTPLD